jgi:hypothetical protein
MAPIILKKKKKRTAVDAWKVLESDYTVTTLPVTVLKKCIPTSTVFKHAVIFRRHI